MTHWNGKVGAALIAACLITTSCTQETKTETVSKGGAKGQMPTRVVSTEPGVPGGTVEETFTAEVKVEAVDQATRRITLSDETGHKGTYVAGPHVQNLDKIRAGDRFSATFNQRLTVFVRTGDEKPSMTEASRVAGAPKGATPGMMIAEDIQAVAKVTAIDPDTRMVTMQFSTGVSRNVKVRPDVDLSRYSVGDNVVIGISSTLSVLKAKS